MGGMPPQPYPVPLPDIFVSCLVPLPYLTVPYCPIFVLFKIWDKYG
jgi:hypothetical protein